MEKHDNHNWICNDGRHPFLTEYKCLDCSIVCVVQDHDKPFSKELCLESKPIPVMRSVMQKVLVFITQTPSLRAAIEGCKCEDPTALITAWLQNREPSSRIENDIHNTPIESLEPASKDYQYPTGLHALADGWKLLGPPQSYHERVRLNEEVTFWEWWMVK